MKKIPLLLAMLVLAILTNAAIVDIPGLTLKKVPQTGSNHGLLSKYYLIKSGQDINHHVSDSSSGKFLITKNTSIRFDVIVDNILAIGVGNEYDKIIKAYMNPGQIFRSVSETKETEIGFSRWGFKKKYSLETPITSYVSCQSNPAVVIIRSEVVKKTVFTFSVWSIVKLILIFILGCIISDMFYIARKHPKDKWPFILNAIMGDNSMNILYLVLGAFAACFAAATTPIFAAISAATLLLPLSLNFLPDKGKETN